MFKNKLYILFLVAIILFPLALFSQKDTIISPYDYSIKELTNVQIVTGTIKKSEAKIAPSNVTIITKQMIDERAYQTLVDVCQDMSEFDFMMYNDGGGEYPGYSKNRGLGEVGNPEVLIMINGVVQNNISFNWSQMWTYENMFIDVDRIEIVQGPGSVLYGAQAFSGVINIITDKKFNGVEAVSSFGSFNSWKNDIKIGKELTENLHFSMSYHQYHSQGDQGKNSYDPAGYFTKNLYPNTILSDYDNNGNFIKNTPGINAGKYIPDGYNNSKDSYALRSSLKYKNTKLSFFFSDYIRGNSSAISGYEYFLTDKENVTNFRSYNIDLSNKFKINNKLRLNSSLVYRESNILPSSGFKYLYRFPSLLKNYKAYATQAYIEERFLYDLNLNTSILLGVKATYNIKTDRIVSLGESGDSKTKTISSWYEAKEGNGINILKEYPVFIEKELAAYALWDNNWTKNFITSIGLRLDYNENFGNVYNPRFAIMYNPMSEINVKVLYGTAFRQAGVFELYNEFRGNENLTPERIRTGELEINSLFFNSKLSIKTNIFHSIIADYIGKKYDPSKPSGERFENIDDFNLTGISIYLSAQILENLRFYSNSTYMLGLNTYDVRLYELDDIAKFKLNAGLNLKFLKNKLVADFRTNYIGKRKAPNTNIWLNLYENGYAPAYLKANLSIMYKFFDYFQIQFVVNNIFNEQYYGVGRESGSAMIDDYHPSLNINPAGYIPAYHPQEGRNYLLNFIYKF